MSRAGHIRHKKKTGPATAADINIIAYCPARVNPKTGNQAPPPRPAGRARPAPTTARGAPTTAARAHRAQLRQAHPSAGSAEAPGRARRSRKDQERRRTEERRKQAASPETGRQGAEGRRRWPRSGGEDPGAGALKLAVVPVNFKRIQPGPARRGHTLKRRRTRSAGPRRSPQPETTTPEAQERRRAEERRHQRPRK